MDERTVGLWVKRFSLASDAQAHRFNKFATYFENMYAIVNDGDMAKWRSKVVIPVLAEKAWHIIAKLSTGKAGWNVIAKSEEWEDNAKNQEDLLAHQYENPEFDKPMFIKLTESLIDAVVTGTAVAKVPWCVKDKVEHQRIIEDGVVDLSKETKTTTKVSYNDLIPVNIFDVYIAPKSTSLQAANWIIIRSERALADLKESGVYKNLDKLTAGKLDDPSSAFKQKRQALTNSDDSDTTTDMVEVFECYDRINKKIITIANRSVVIRNEKNDYWHGKYPLVAFNIKPRSYDFWGEGLFEVTERLAAGINDSFNHFMDNWNLSVDGMLIREQNSDVDDFIVEPGGEITYKGTKPEFAKFPTPDAASFQNIRQVLGQSIEGLTISGYAAGQSGSEADQTKGTATGIIKLQEAAQDLLGFMRYMFKTAVKEIGTQWMSNNLQYLDAPVDVIYEEGMKTLSKTMYPEEQQGRFELTVDASVMEPMSKDMRRESKLAFLDKFKDMYALAQQQVGIDPMTGQPKENPIYVNVPNILESLSEDFGVKDFDKWTERPEEGEMLPENALPQENLAPEMPQNELLPPEMTNMPQIPQMPVEPMEMPQEEEPNLFQKIIGKLRGN